MLEKEVLLKNLKTPTLGLGTWQLQGQDCQNAIKEALKIGYRHIDTAHIYANHHDIAQGLKESDVSRDELFITSKLWRGEAFDTKVRKACERAIRELECEYLDLYLIHWPETEFVDPAETLTSMEELKKEGLIKGYGVSNFTINHLKPLVEEFDIETNQVEYHPSLNQVELNEFCKNNNFRLTAYSPLGRGHDLNLTEVINLAGKYSATPGQVVLYWLMSRGLVVIPKATTTTHLQDNFDTLSLDIKDADLERLDGLNTSNRLVNPGFAEFEN